MTTQQAENMISALSFGRVTQHTAVVIVWSGPGYMSSPLGFNSVEDARVVFGIVRDQGMYKGSPVNYARVIGKNGTIWSGRIRAK